MKKRILALFLVAILGITLVACTQNTPSTDTGSDTVQGTNSGSEESSSSVTDTNSQSGTVSDTDSDVTDTSASITTSTTTNTTTNTSTNTNTSSSTSTKTEVQTPVVPDVPVYDETLDHKVILTDVTRGSIVVLDLDEREDDWRNMNWIKSGAKTRIWEMDLGDSSICGVKYRYSPYYQKDVILVTSSAGKAYILDYEEKTILWQVNDRINNNFDISLYNAHSIEMLPNGDIVIASSGYAEQGCSYENGGVHYYPAGSTTRGDFYNLPFAHAVHWDPDNECVWTVGFEGVVALKVTGEGKNARFSKINELSYAKNQFTGHDLVPAFGMDGKYWISDNDSVYLYDSATQTLARSRDYVASAVKGIAYFEDGTMILSPATENTYSKMLEVYVTTPQTRYKPRKNLVPTAEGVYKIHVFTKDYN